MYKQVIVVRKDLQISSGKLAAQVSHASIGSYKKTDKEIIKKWESEGGKKVVLGVETEKELLNLQGKANQLGLPTFLVIDAGLTELPKSTVTSLGIGPAKENEIDKLTGDLPLLN